MTIAVIIAAAVLVIVLGASSATAAPSGEGIQPMIRRIAVDRGDDPALLLAIAHQESSFRPEAQNPNDPSYGLFGISPFWLEYFGYPNDPTLLFDPKFSIEMVTQILDYFRSKGFTFPAQVDIYNVGETLWRQGRRNIAYRDSVIGYYRNIV